MATVALVLAVVAIVIGVGAWLAIIDLRSRLAERHPGP